MRLVLLDVVFFLLIFVVVARNAAAAAETSGLSKAPLVKKRFDDCQSHNVDNNKTPVHPVVRHYKFHHVA